MNLAKVINNPLGAVEDVNLIKYLYKFLTYLYFKYSIYLISIINYKLCIFYYRK